MRKNYNNVHESDPVNNCRLMKVLFELLGFNDILLSVFTLCHTLQLLLIKVKE